jgi:hypothetical protein
VDFFVIINGNSSQADVAHGYIYFPAGSVASSDLQATVVVDIVPNPQGSSDLDVASVAIDVTLSEDDTIQNAITICFDATTVIDTKISCLAYFNQYVNKFVCESQLTVDEDGFYCGETTHLSQWALIQMKGM